MTLKKLLKNDRGAALVEFGIVTPVLLLFLAVIIDGARMAWSYQMVANGVRDAARTLARTAPTDLCTTGAIGTYAASMTTIVTNDVSGATILPTGSRITNVEPTVRCVAGAFSDGSATVIEVTATLEVDYILGGVFGLFGAQRIERLTTRVSDQSRVYGV